MRFDIITIFPNVFEEYFNTSIIGRTKQRKLIHIKTHNLRDFTNDKHKTVDDKPYGGGAGMVLMAKPIIKAVEHITKTQKSQKHKKPKIILFSAKGKQFTQKLAQTYAKNYDQLIMICGRYEGVDERVKKILKVDELSIGSYVLTGGELPAMITIDAITRLLPNVITQESLTEESYSSILQLLTSNSQLLKEYPHYTRPEVIEYQNKKFRVPKVLLSGHHKEIMNWRRGKIRKYKIK